MEERSFDELENTAFDAVEQIIAANRDVYVTQVKLEVAKEYNNLDQVIALMEKMIALHESNREHMFRLLDAVIRIGEQGKRSKRFMELYRDLVEQVSDPNNVSLFGCEHTENGES